MWRLSTQTPQHRAGRTINKQPEHQSHKCVLNVVVLLRRVLLLLCVGFSLWLYFFCVQRCLFMMMKNVVTFHPSKRRRDNSAYFPTKSSGCSSNCVQVVWSMYPVSSETLCYMLDSNTLRILYTQTNTRTDKSLFVSVCFFIFTYWAPVKSFSKQHWRPADLQIEQSISH